jgi:uncharacterized membrane protein
MNENQLLSLVFAGIGILFVAVSIPLIRRKVGPNIIYGVRTRKTLSDDKLWYEANHRFGKDFLLSGVGVFLVAVAAGIFGDSLEPNLLTAILVGAMLAGVAFSAIRCWRSCGIF